MINVVFWNMLVLFFIFILFYNFLLKGVYGVEEKFVKLVIRYIEVKNLMFMVNISVVYFMFNVCSKLML